MVLDELREVGMRIALDDVGTGYSSLSYLQQLPIDVVTIDQSFIATLGEDAGPNACALLGAVIDLPHALRKTVVAEGVETEAQHRELVALGCETSQGFLFAKPMSHDEVRALLLTASAETRR